MIRRLSMLLMAGVMLPAAGSPVLAQTGRGYAGGSLGTFAVSADSVSGTSAAATIVAGLRVTRWLDLEGEITRPTAPFTRSYGGDVLSLSFASTGASPEELERMGIWLRYDQRRDIPVSFSGAAVFHPAASTRVTPALILGVTNHRVRDRTDYTPTRVGAGVDPANPYARPHAETSTRTLGALTIGANVAIALTPRLAVVPDVRYDYGSIGDEINNSLRSSLRLMWRF